MGGRRRRKRERRRRSSTRRRSRRRRRRRRKGDECEACLKPRAHLLHLVAVGGEGAEASIFCKKTKRDGRGQVVRTGDAGRRRGRRIHVSRDARAGRAHRHGSRCACNGANGRGLARSRQRRTHERLCWGIYNMHITFTNQVWARAKSGGSSSPASSAAFT